MDQKLKIIDKLNMLSRHSGKTYYARKKQDKSCRIFCEDWESGYYQVDPAELEDAFNITFDKTHEGILVCVYIRGEGWVAGQYRYGWVFVEHDKSFDSLNRIPTDKYAHLQISCLVLGGNDTALSRRSKADLFISNVLRIERPW
jgi:hypothetical protein